MVGERLKDSGTGGGLSLSVVDLFAGTLLAVFVMFVIYIWIHQDPISECFYDFREHAQDVFDDRPDTFLQEPEFSFLTARFVLRESWLSFEPCLWVLPEENQRQLRELFAALIAEEHRACVESLRIEGHADRQPFSLTGCVAAHPARAAELRRIGPWDDNTQLSQNRARAVFQSLRELTFVEEMWSSHRVHIGGYGESWPLVDDPTSALNRRVEMHLKFYEAETRQTESNRSDADQ